MPFMGPRSRPIPKVLGGRNPLRPSRNRPPGGMVPGGMNDARKARGMARKQAMIAARQKVAGGASQEVPKQEGAE